MLPRHLQQPVLNAVADTPVVFVQGARQVGKSTLVRALAAQPLDATYVTLDDATALTAARHDPTGFVAGLRPPVVLDEVQRADGLGLAIKQRVDRERTPGSFLLTGSAGVLVLPELSSSLVGRMEVLTLWPFSQGERAGVRERFIDRVFDGRVPDVTGSGKGAVLERALAGGYPEAVTRAPDRRERWFDAYVTTVLQREVRDLSRVADLAAVPRLLALIAARAGGLLNFAELSRDSGLAQTTLKRYFALLAGTFMVHTVPAWSGNLGKRLTKSPKVHLTDTGLMSHLQGLDADRLRRLPHLAGPLIEALVAGEIARANAWSRTRPGLFHYRTAAGQEVDLVLEDRAGRVVGIEVKAAESVRRTDTRGLSRLRDTLGDRFVRGIVLYCGERTVDFGPDLQAVPIDALWS